MAEPIVVVGTSAVTCLGGDLDATWAGLVAGRSGLKRLERLTPDLFLQDVVGAVDPLDDDPAAARLEARSIHLAMRAARAVWADAGLPPTASEVVEGYDRDRVAVCIGSAFGGLDLLRAEGERLAAKRSLHTSPYLVPGLIVNQQAGQVAQALGLYGPSVAPANACASGAHSIILGAMLLRAGEVDLALCGAAESGFTPEIINGFATMKAMFGRRKDDRAEADPSQASRPFSVDRAGFILAEGAGMVALATRESARRLGLRPRAELAGWSMNSDGHHMAIPHPERVAKCLHRAIEHAGVVPSAIDYYNAHGTSTQVNDRVESQAIRDVFGDHAERLPISSIKGAIGHSLGAASAIEAAVCVRALEAGVIPPTINYRSDPELDLDYVPNVARPAGLVTVMSASFGFGGTNNALVLRSLADG